MLKHFEQNKRSLTFAIIGLIIIVLIMVFLFFKNESVTVAPETSEESTKNVITGDVVTDPPTEQDEVTTPTSAADFYSQGFLDFQGGKYSQAIEKFDSAISMDPENANYYAKKSEAQYNLGNKEEAIQTVKDGLVALPDNDFLKTKLDILNKEWFGNQPQ